MLGNKKVFVLSEVVSKWYKLTIQYSWCAYYVWASTDRMNWLSIDVCMWLMWWHTETILGDVIYSIPDFCNLEMYHIAILVRIKFGCMCDGFAMQCHVMLLNASKKFWLILIWWLQRQTAKLPNLIPCQIIWLYDMRLVASNTYDKVGIMLWRVIFMKG